MGSGVTQADLAEAVGLSFQQIQKYESGANRLVSNRLFELTSVLGVPMDAERKRERGGASAVQSKGRDAGNDRARRRLLQERGTAGKLRRLSIGASVKITRKSCEKS
jgi:transcriptional regulator with XRE-family HTH domain